jgi:transcriptional regulator with XRE-family HTH domain
MSELKAFAGLHQALAHLCLRDGRARKDIAEAAGINASMLSGYCSGRLVPSLEHLDRLLTALGVALEDLAAELRLVNQRRTPAAATLEVLSSPEPPEDEVATRLWATLLKDVARLVHEEARRSAAEPELEPEPLFSPSRSPSDAPPRPKAGRRRGAKPGG